MREVNVAIADDNERILDMLGSGCCSQLYLS